MKIGTSSAKIPNSKPTRCGSFGEVVQEADGGFCAECLSDTIVTEADTWEELRRNVQEVVRAFYFDQPEKLPATIRLEAKTDQTMG